MFELLIMLAIFYFTTNFKESRKIVEISSDKEVLGWVEMRKYPFEVDLIPLKDIELKEVKKKGN